MEAEGKLHTIITTSSSMSVNPRFFPIREMAETVNIVASAAKKILGSWWDGAGSEFPPLKGLGRWQPRFPLGKLLHRPPTSVPPLGAVGGCDPFFILYEPTDHWLECLPTFRRGALGMLGLLRRRRA